jgi:aminopeptidase 2
MQAFKATDARRAFPCWDEPALKATYSITMISRADTVNLSNMPAAAEEIINQDKHTLFPDLSFAPGQWKETKFETTPLVSSYLVAFANGPFEHKEASVKMPLSGKTLPLRIYSEICPCIWPERLGSETSSSNER